MNLPRLAACAALSALFSACSSSGTSLPETASAPSAIAYTPVAASSLDAWHSALIANKLPTAGCYTASYPSTQWNRIACVTPPQVYFPVPRSRHPQLGQTVGDGNDYTIDTTPHIVSSATGAFPKVSGVKSVVSGGDSDSYTLQLNSNFFQTAQCGSLANCAGWSQFVFFNPGPSSNQGFLFIQDWLVALKSDFTQCPPGKGWQNLGIGCVQNSPGSVGMPILNVTDLASAAVTGDADKSGDSIYMTIGKHAYGMKNIQSDGITDLSKHWQGAEFNVIGNGGGDQADFNSGSKITVSIEANDGVKTKPTCPGQSGTTGETNNLFLVKAPATIQKLQYPSVEFSMSSKQGKTSTCNAAKGAG